MMVIIYSGTVREICIEWVLIIFGKNPSAQTGHDANFQQLFQRRHHLAYFEFSKTQINILFLSKMQLLMQHMQIKKLPNLLPYMS